MTEPGLPWGQACVLVARDTCDSLRHTIPGVNAIHPGRFAFPGLQPDGGRRCVPQTPAVAMVEPADRRQGRPINRFGSFVIRTQVAQDS